MHLLIFFIILQFLIIIWKVIGKFGFSENLEFPKNYPTGCLLGKVNIADCLPQDQYREMHPDGLSESPFVFICENSQELPFFLPIKGAHKLCKKTIKFINPRSMTLHKTLIKQAH